MAPVLYKMNGSPPANAVRMLADLIELDLDLKDVDFRTKEHKSPEYMKLNPMGTIPTLQDGDFVISESHTIMKYLLSKYGGVKAEQLYPSEVRTRALVDQCLFFDTGVFFIKIKVVALPSVYGDLTGPSDQDREDIDTAYGVVEAYLGSAPYVAGERLTLADISLGATTAAMQPIHKLDANRFPRTAAWYSRLGEEPWFKKIMVPGAELLGQVLKACWQKNKEKKL